MLWLSSSLISLFTLVLINGGRCGASAHDSFLYPSGGDSAVYNGQPTLVPDISLSPAFIENRFLHFLPSLQIMRKDPASPEEVEAINRRLSFSIVAASPSSGLSQIHDHEVAAAWFLQNSLGFSPDAASKLPAQYAANCKLSHHIKALIRVMEELQDLLRENCFRGFLRSCYFEVRPVAAT